MDAVGGGLGWADDHTVHVLPDRKPNRVQLVHCVFICVHKERCDTDLAEKAFDLTEDDGKVRIDDVGQEIFVTGHSEYDADTLNREYVRDKKLGLPIEPPANYFPDDDDTQEPIVRWRGHAHLLFSNWLNYFVYQTTPYDIMTIGQTDEET